MNLAQIIAAHNPEFKAAMEKKQADDQAFQTLVQNTRGIPVKQEDVEAWQAAHPDMTVVANSDYGISTPDPSVLGGRNIGGFTAFPTDFINQYTNRNIQNTRLQQSEDPSTFLGGAVNAGIDMKGGLSILAMAAGAGALGGAGAAEGAGAAGAAGGAGTVGFDAGTGLYAGESAAGAGTSGTLGGFGGGATGAGGALSGTEGSGALLGGAGGDTLSMPAAQFEDPLGGYNTDPNTGDVFYGTGDNPFGSNFSGGGPNAMDGSGLNPDGSYGPGFLDQAKQQALDMAKQFGITPASALQALIKGAGRGIPAALGAIGANKQANSLSALADKYMALGAPSRARYEASFAPGFTMENDPGYKDALEQSSKATLHGLSVQGNPAGSPNAWAQSLQDNYAKTAYPALQNFRNTNANAGGIASLQTAAPAAATGAIGAQGNVFNAIGGGINDIFNPQPSLAETLAQYQKLLKGTSGAVA